VELPSDLAYLGRRIEAVSGGSYSYLAQSHHYGYVCDPAQPPTASPAFQERSRRCTG
jgi:hypothetical protein